MIISYFTSEFGDTSTYSPDEIDDMAFSELYTRAQTLMRTISACGVNGKILNSVELAELLYVAYNREQSEIYTLRNALNSEYDRLYSTARDVMEERKKRLAMQVEEDAAKLTSKSIIKADLENRKRREEKVKARAMQMVEEYKNDMSTTLYEETKKQIQNADVSKELEDKPKRRITRKNV